MDAAVGMFPGTTLAWVALVRPIHRSRKDYRMDEARENVSNPKGNEKPELQRAQRAFEDVAGKRLVTRAAF